MEQNAKLAFTRHVAMRDAIATLGEEEFVGSMEQRNQHTESAVMSDARTMSSMEVCAQGMGRRNICVRTQDAQTKGLMWESALGT